MKDCIFCKIVSKEFPSHSIYEDETHIAFLSIFPNTNGFSVVIPKKHYSGHAFHQDTKILQELIAVAQKVTRRIEAAFDDVGRVAAVIEGLGVDHLHIKLIPLHGTNKDGSWNGDSHAPGTYFEKYEGYVSSHDSARADDGQLAMQAKRIREVK